MKIVTASNGKNVLKISKKEWENIGKKAGWQYEDDYLEPSRHGFYGREEYNKIHNQKDEDLDENSEQTYSEEVLYDAWGRIDKLPEPLKSDFMSFCHNLALVCRILRKINKRLRMSEKQFSVLIGLCKKYLSQCMELKEKFQENTTPEMKVISQSLIEDIADVLGNSDFPNVSFWNAVKWLSL